MSKVAATELPRPATESFKSIAAPSSPARADTSYVPAKELWKPASEPPSTELAASAQPDAQAPRVAVATPWSVARTVRLYRRQRLTPNTRLAPLSQLAGAVWVTLIADVVRLRLPPNRAWAALLTPIPAAAHGGTLGSTFHLFLDRLVVHWIAVRGRRGDLKRLRG